MAPQLVSREQVYQNLTTLQTLRNAIAHGNGRRGVVRKKTWDTIIKNPLVVVYDDYLDERVIPSPDLVRQLHEAVRDALLDLIARAKKRSASSEKNRITDGIEDE